MKKGFLAVMICAFFAVNAEASMISFFVVEAGLTERESRRRHSELWESALMDVFFDAGYIVSNFPITRIVSKPANGIVEASGFDLNEAKDGGIDFIIIAQLDYSSNIQPPVEVMLYIFKIAQHEIIYEKKYTGTNFRTEREIYDELKKSIRELIPFIAGI